jgi:hypothetical protein
VSYTTDGITWTSIGKVNVSDWQKMTVTLPIADWKDLTALQIRIQGIPTTQDPVPPVYLDGMFMEVHYDSAPSVTTPDAATSTDETASSTPSSTIAPRMTLVDPGAQQTCDIQPFSQVLPVGGVATFMVEMHPSINGVSYDLQTGYLPAGISATIASPIGAIAATSSLIFEASQDAEPGSVNLAVIYHEHENDGTVLANFCQLNIVVR